jgi:dTDP-4-dehydrorhamnose reductase
MKDANSLPIRKVVVLGGSGMLGYTTSRFLSESLPGISIVSTYRKLKPKSSHTSNLNFIPLDFSNSKTHNLAEVTKGADLVVNCAGLIWQRARENQQERDFNLVNFELPLAVEKLQLSRHFNVIHVGTDCVFRGESLGGYIETCLPNAQDLYGRSKALADLNLKNALVLRSSIVGRGLMGNFSILDWFLSTPYNQEILGYTNHTWNGIGTIQFARIIRGLLLNPASIKSGVQHVIPENTVSKYELLEIFKSTFGRLDVRVIPHETNDSINRSLSTAYPDRNHRLWTDAGYENVPSIRDMMEEMSKKYHGWGLV